MMAVSLIFACLVALYMCAPTPQDDIEPLEVTNDNSGADVSINRPNKSPILPALTGKYCVGKLKPEFHKDVSRNDPFSTINPNARREIVIQVYYPTKDGLHDKIPCLSNEEYMTQKEADWANKYFAGAVDQNYLRSIKHHSKTNAKFEAHSKQRLHIFSHGFGCSRTIYQAMIEDVVSHGDIVVVVEHPYDAGIIDVDGRVIYINPTLFSGPIDTRPDIAEDVGVRIEDIYFAMNIIQNKKVTFPKNCKNSHELVKNSGMFGHSMGGQLSLNVILKEQKENNKRIHAGVNLDGWFWLDANATAQNPPEKSNGNTPYMTMRSDKNNLPPPFDWAGGGPMNEINTMKVQKPKKQQVLPEYPLAQHFVYSDAVSYWAMTNNQTIRSALEASFIGTVNGNEAHIATVKYLKWFFDNTVRGLGDPNIIHLGQTKKIPQLYLRDIN